MRQNPTKTRNHTAELEALFADNAAQLEKLSVELEALFKHNAAQWDARVLEQATGGELSPLTRTY